MSRALTTGASWPGAYRVIGVLQVVLTVILLLSLPLWRVRPADAQGTNGGDGVDDEETRTEPGTAAPTPHLSVLQAVLIPGVVPLLVAFLCYCALEQTSMLWAATYLKTVRGVGAATAAAFGSSFILGLTTGRVLAGFVADRVGDRLLIRWGFAAFGIGMVVVALPVGATWPALAGFVLAGVGAAPVYPAIIHSTPGLFGAERSQAIVGIEMASAYLGTLLMPPLFGVLAGWTSQRLLPWYLGVFVVLGLVMSERLNRLTDGTARG